MKPFMKKIQFIFKIHFNIFKCFEYFNKENILI